MNKTSRSSTTLLPTQMPTQMPDHRPDHRPAAQRLQLTLIGAAAIAALAAAPRAQAQGAAAPPAPAASAPAATDGATEFSTVTVTARKRAETLTQTPAAISVFGAQEIEQRNINSLSDIGKYVPNLDINRFGVANPAHAAIFIRGIGLQDHIITTDPGVGVYLDGVYLGRQMGANLGLTNIARVEVLRGPQGTLYGKNTLGGAINIVTIQPGDEERKQVDLKIGTRGRVQADLYGNTAINDMLAVSANADVKRRNGIGKALLVDAPKDVGEEFEYSGRVAAKLKVNNDVSLLWTVDGVRGNNGKSPTTIEIFDRNAFFTGTLGLDESQLPADSDDSNSGQAGLFRQTNKGAGTSLTANWRIDDNLSARVLTSYRYSSYTGGLDDDNTFADLESFPETGYARQLSIEPQLNGEFGKLDFVTGLYYGTEKGNTNSGPWVYIGPGGFFDLKQKSKSYAAYGHVGYQLYDDFKISGGLRYSRDTKDASAQFDNWSDPSRVFREKSWNATTFDISAAYDLIKTKGREVSTYATVSTGYQSGGFPPRPFSGPAAFVSFDQTKATNYEVGIKGVFFEQRLLANVSVFYTQYKDLPLQVSQPSASGFNTFVESAGKARSQGIELDGTLKITRAFSVQAAIGYLDSQVTAVPATATSIKVGFTPALTPTWTAAVSPMLRLNTANGASIDARVDYSYRGKMYGQSANNAINEIDSRKLVGFNVAYTPADAKWSLAFYGQNIFNEVYDVGRLDDSFAGFADVIRSNDRSEFGIKASYVF